MHLAVNCLIECKCPADEKDSSLEGNQAGIRRAHSERRENSRRHKHKKLKPLIKRTAIPAERRKRKEEAQDLPPNGIGDSQKHH
jgi:hypothetical protein